MSMLISILGILFVFGMVIFIHEFGHFFVAKKSGVKVERFSFGLGPEMFGFQWGETRYCIAWIPLGGEVRMAGEAEFEEGDPSQPPKAGDPRDFFAQPWYKRTAIALAGPAMNYVLAVFIFALVAFVWGETRPSDKAAIGDLVSGYPAQQAGLQRGDLFVSVAGKPVSTWEEVAKQIHQYPEQAIDLVIERAGSRQTFNVTPRVSPQGGVGIIGIAPEAIFTPIGLFPSIEKGFVEAIGWSYFTVAYLGEKIIKREKPDLAGPVGIATVVSDATKKGARHFLYLMALISVGIGLFNLFPIPLLDGGHIVFYLWEGLTKRPATRKIMERANMVGLSLLLSILVFATYSDIQRIRTSKKKPPAVDQPVVSEPAQK